ncbi:helix-turn-helix domain-containing protein [Tautonia sociabilis]|nr:helix-turn-helix domain-containing protein [Tautonia sociabilis]
MKTRQLAQMLDVSVSTIKRWVDQGELPATRTIGKHRLIPLSGALRFAEQRGLRTDRLQHFAAHQIAGDPAEAIDHPERVVTPQALARAIRRGHNARARFLIKLAAATWQNAATLADRLIEPALAEIGHDWERQVVDIYEEHLATRIVETTLIELIQDQVPPAANAPMALGAAPEGDPYTIANLLAELTLRELGWRVINLGPNLPLDSLARAVLAYQPCLTWISVSHLNDPDRFIRHYQSFYASVCRTETAVILGGAALTPEIRAELLAAGFGNRMAHLREFACRLRPRTRPQTDSQTTDRLTATDT